MLYVWKISLFLTERYNASEKNPVVGFKLITSSAPTTEPKNQFPEVNVKNYLKDYESPGAHIPDEPPTLRTSVVIQRCICNSLNPLGGIRIHNFRLQKTNTQTTQPKDRFPVAVVRDGIYTTLVGVHSALIVWSISSIYFYFSTCF